MLLLRIILISGIVFLLYKLLILLLRGKKRKSPQAGPGAGRLEEMKKDPVCGTYIPESQAVTLRHNNQLYYFCSENCKKKFAGKKTDEI